MSSGTVERWRQDLLTPPTVHALSLEDAKRHLRIEYDHDDADIESNLTAAEQYIENRTGIALAPQTRLMKIPCFPRFGLQLIWPPFVSATVAVLDETDTPQPFTEFYVTTSELLPALMMPNDEWPVVGSTRVDAVQITIECGYTECQQDLQRAIKTRLDMLYQPDQDLSDLRERTLNSLLAGHHKGSYDGY